MGEKAWRRITVGLLQWACPIVASGKAPPAQSLPMKTGVYLPSWPRLRSLNVRAAGPARQWLLTAFACALLITLASNTSAADTTRVLDTAEAVTSGEAHFPAGKATTQVLLPDDWSQSRPNGSSHSRSVWYRMRFERPSGTAPDDLWGVHIERGCRQLDIDLNGRRIFSRNGASASDDNEESVSLTRPCASPQVVALPAAWLQQGRNTLDIRVQGDPLERVSLRQNAAGLSALHIGPLPALSKAVESQTLWRVTLQRVIGVVMLVLGGVILALSRVTRREPHLLYFGLLSLSGALMSVLTGQGALPLPISPQMAELLTPAALAVTVAMAVQFMLVRAEIHQAMHSKSIRSALLVQALIVPVSLWVIRPDEMFQVSMSWYALMTLEVHAAMLVFLLLTWRRRPKEFKLMFGLLSGISLLMLNELAVQFGWLAVQPVQALQFGLLALVVAVSFQLLAEFGDTLRAIESERISMASRVREATDEMERNFNQLAELRVEQITVQERKRIAADLHDDLGAKLLTIVHTSESERISTLAREALEEMRLSVRSLTGKPVRLADALADWRAEVVSRLGQANIEADWRSPDDVEQLLQARAFVQATRILREAVSNIIKHSGASNCKVRCIVSQSEFAVSVRDNGKGISTELDGRLDRGHGMSSMKHRAKQLKGQCLVESSPGYGTVIRLTLPL